MADNKTSSPEINSTKNQPFGTTQSKREALIICKKNEISFDITIDIDDNLKEMYIIMHQSCGMIKYWLCDRRRGMPLRNEIDGILRRLEITKDDNTTNKS